MKFVWLIAIVLAILFGVSVGLSFLAVLWLGVVVLLVVAAIYMAIMQFIGKKIGSALCWLAAAAFFGWLLSVCF